MKILGIDPGYAIVGFGGVEYVGAAFTVICKGTIVTDKAAHQADRLEEIHRDIADIIYSVKPDAVAVERLYFQNNQKTAIKVAEARGVILMSIAEQRVPIFEFTPLQVKQSVTGYGKAVKAQVLAMTKGILKLDAVPKPDDIADALAIAICCAHTIGKNLNRTNADKILAK